MGTLRGLRGYDSAVVEDRLHTLLELWNVAHHSLPHRVEVDPKVEVDQDIPHRFDERPGNLRVTLQAVDSAYNGGPVAEGSFTVGGVPPLFGDGFESGDLSAWSAAAP